VKLQVMYKRPVPPGWNKLRFWTQKGIKFNNPFNTDDSLDNRKTEQNKRKKSVWVVGNLNEVQITCLLYKSRRHYSHNNLVGCSGHKLTVPKSWMGQQAASMIGNWNVSGRSTMQRVIFSWGIPAVFSIINKEYKTFQSNTTFLYIT